MASFWATYKAHPEAYDEMFSRDGKARLPYAVMDSRISTLPLEELNRRQQACEQSFLHQGITFTVYNDNKATERIIPTDLLPRIVTANEEEPAYQIVQRLRAARLGLAAVLDRERHLRGIVTIEDLVRRLVSSTEAST